MGGGGGGGGGNYDCIKFKDLDRSIFARSLYQI